MEVVGDAVTETLWETLCDPLTVFEGVTVAVAELVMDDEVDPVMEAVWDSVAVMDALAVAL